MRGRVRFLWAVVSGRRRYQVLCQCGRLHELSLRSWEQTPSGYKRIAYGDSQLWPHYSTLKKVGP